MYLIVGASGRLGRAVTQRLVAAGQPVRVMTRTPASLNALQQAGVEIVAGDLLDVASLRNACRGVTHVLAAAHALVGKGPNTPEAVDGTGNRHLIDVAVAAGVQHFVFMSLVGAAPDAPIPFFRVKYATERYLRTSGLPYTIIRPTSFLDLWAQVIGQPILDRGKTVIFGSGNNPINFVAVDDVAAYVQMALTNPAARNRIIEVGGPENLTLNQFAALFERRRGHVAKKRYLARWQMQTLARMLRTVNPSASRQIEMGVYLDSADLRFDMSETHRLFPLPTTSASEWVTHHAFSREHTALAKPVVGNAQHSS